MQILCTVIDCVAVLLIAGVRGEEGERGVGWEYLMTQKTSCLFHNLPINLREREGEREREDMRVHLYSIACIHVHTGRGSSKVA